MSSNPPQQQNNGGVFNRRALIIVGIGAVGVLAAIIVIRFISVKKSTTGSSVQSGQQIGTDANGNPIYAQAGGGDQFVNEVAYENLANGTQNIYGDNNFGPNSDINYAPPAPNPSHPGRPPRPPRPGPLPGPGVGVGISPSPIQIGGGVPAPGPNPVPFPGGGTPAPGPSPVPQPGGGGTPAPGPGPVPRPGGGGGGVPAPVPPPSPVPRPSRPGAPRMYTVQAGDTLASIARRFNVSGGAASLGQSNDTTLKQVAVGHGISPAATSRFGAYPAAWDFIFPGEVIRLPGQPVYTGTAPNPVNGSGFGTGGSGSGGVPAGGPR